jgi:hypothetical protein
MNPDTFMSGSKKGEKGEKSLSFFCPPGFSGKAQGNNRAEDWCNDQDLHWQSSNQDQIKPDKVDIFYQPAKTTLG